MFAELAELIISWMASGGYVVLFILMGLESMIAPIPSEVVMPFAGYLVADGSFSLLGVIIFSTLGSLVGSLISYWMGIFGGRKFVLKFGKYLLLDEEHLAWTEKFFKKSGGKTIFISRFIPVVRHLISIPAGIGKMGLKKFCLYTVLGAGLWNVFLVYVGIWLNEKWHLVHEYSSQIDIVIIILLVLVVGWFVYRHIKKGKKYKS